MDNTNSNSHDLDHESNSASPSEALPGTIGRGLFASSDFSAGSFEKTWQSSWNLPMPGASFKPQIIQSARKGIVSTDMPDKGSWIRSLQPSNWNQPENDQNKSAEFLSSLIFREIHPKLDFIPLFPGQIWCGRWLHQQIGRVLLWRWRILWTHQALLAQEKFLLVAGRLEMTIFQLSVLLHKFLKPGFVKPKDLVKGMEWSYEVQKKTSWGFCTPCEAFGTMVLLYSISFIALIFRLRVCLKSTSPQFFVSQGLEDADTKWSL